ncbi:MAG: gliding motility-associated C-terminal domain-containing protein [Bacteroidetes bacterium]|nr:gliding motility-associated C-terminal domain-containing protein [Bacteroidota bacterium]
MRKFTFYFIFSLLISISGAQTLYWIGGRGNFNDAKHWSTSSGGNQAGVIPSKQSVLIIDENSGADATINLTGKNVCKSFYAYGENKKTVLNGLTNASLEVEETFFLSPNTKLTGRIDYLFKNTLTPLNNSYVEVRNLKLNGNLVFESGSWSISSLGVDTGYSIYFNEGNFSFVNSSIECKSFHITPNKTHFVNYPHLVKTNKLKSAMNSSELKFFGDNNARLNQYNSTASACSILYGVTSPSCAGQQGIISITITPGCSSGPYTLQANCIDACFPFSSLAVSGPTVLTYTVTGCGNNSVDFALIDNTYTVTGSPVAILMGQNLPVNPTAINLNVISTTVASCFGVCDAKQRVSVNGGGTPNYTIYASPLSSSLTTGAFSAKTFTSLCSGPISYTVTNDNGCKFTFSSFIAPTPSIVISALSTSVSCNGACDGTFSITPSGGTPNYTINFSTGTNSNNISPATSVSIASLCPGVYTATLTDSKGCNTNTSVTITQPPAITVTATQTNVTCFGLCNGSASVQVTGGTPAYTYTWSPSPGNSNSITSVCSGSQIVTIKDANSCTKTATFNITQPSSITITPTITNVVCSGSCTGAASVTASGGTGIISFTWVAPGPSTIATTAFINNQCAGTYTVFAKDATGCTTQSIVTITQPPTFTISAQSTSVQCFGACNGAATVNISGGNGAPYTFSWSPAAGSSSTIGGLCQGSYTVSVKDASSCPVQTVVTITQPTSITITPTTSSVTCAIACNGSINVSASGGLAPYSYTLITPAPSTITAAPPYTSLCAGIYTIFVSDAAGCIKTKTTQVIAPNPLLVSVSSTSITCFGLSNGNLAGSVSGGTPSYTLYWGTSSGTVSGGVLSGQAAGTYTFYAQDANGCITNSIVTLNQPTQITSTINTVGPTCFGSCNAIANAGVSGGVPGYTLNWSNGFTGNPNINLCAGTYSLIITDANGCNRTFTTSIVSPPAVTLSLVNSSSVTCAGLCNGGATVVATGGSPVYVYQFNTAPITTNTTGIVTGLCAGSYISSVTDANGCTQSKVFTIIQPTALSAAISGLQNSCNACTGSVIITPSNGTPGYSVIVTNSLGTTVSTSSVATSLCIGSYTATVTDANSCSTTVTFNIAKTVSVTVVAGGGGILCFGACTGSAVATALGGTLPYSYNWAVTGPPAITSATATGLCIGQYTVTATDALGCSDKATIIFTSPPALTVTTTQTNVTCFSLCNGAALATAGGGSGGLTYSWSPMGSTTQSVSALCAGSYTVNVKDGNGCSTSSVVSITQPTSITAIFNATNPSSCTVNNGSICATASGGLGPAYAYSWSPSGGTGGLTNCYTNLGAGSYSVIIKDGAGCTTTLTSFLTNPLGPTLTLNSTSITCFGANTGVASGTATGTGPFTFTWSPVVPFTSVGNISTASGINAGTYNLSSTDALGCITSSNITVTQASSVSVSSIISNLSCNSICNGSITLNTSGGTPAYTYSWLPSGSITSGQGTGTVTSLCAGNYTVNVSDTKSCTVSHTFVLTQPTTISITTTLSNVLCNSLCNGSITANAVGGTAPLSYTWLPIGAFTGSATPAVNNLCPNSYTVIVKDGNLCTTQTIVNITQPTSLTAVLTKTNATCNGSCNAVAQYSISGGTPGYSYSWSGSGATTSMVNNLCSGNYTVVATDANGCSVSQGFTLTSPSVFSAALTPSNPSCNGLCDGAITSTLTGAQGTVTYVWAPVGVGASPNSLCFGNYTLTATDANGCKAYATTILNNPPLMLANVSMSNPLCNGACNGIAVSAPVNNQGAVTYTWLPSGSSSATNTALCAGTYTVILTDSKNCQITQTFALTNPALLNVNSSVGPSTCGSSNGSITVLASGGTPAYNYTWSPPVISTSSVVTSLPAGIYTVSVTDANGCTNTVSIPLSNANGPSSAPIITTSVSCNGQCTGAASVNVSGIVGGTPGYTVSWVSPPAPSASNPLTGLCAGSYTAQVIDVNSCKLFVGTTIAQPSAISMLANVSPPTCIGVCNGSIALSVSGGVPSYNYTWAPAALNSPTFTSACVGVYTVNISDANACSITKTINLPGVLNINATIAQTNNVCYSNCNAVANITAAGGGTPPYNFNWNNGTVSPLNTGLCSGIYSVTATDAIGCNNTFSVSITSAPQLTVASIVTQPSCGLCNGASTVSSTGGTAPYTYTWSTGSSSAAINNLCAGLYQVSVTDAAGCNQMQSVVVNNSSGFTGEIFSQTPLPCTGVCAAGLTVSPIGGNWPYTYNWIGATSTNSMVNGLCAGVYFVVMTDANGCVRTASTTISPASTLSISTTVISPTCGANNGSASVIATGGIAPYTYSWIPSGATTPTIGGLGAGTYSVIVSSTGGTCPKMQVINLSNPTGPSITYTQTNINCYNLCTGSIVVIGTSTSSPITYNWSNGSTASSVSSLCQGPLTVSVSAAGCITTQTFNITQNSDINVGVSNVIQPKCFNVCNGSVTIVGVGGSLPYTYSWSPSGANTNTLSSLCSGTYIATVMDNLGCAKTDTVVLFNPTKIVLTNTLNNSSCTTVSDGSIAISVSGGLPAYTYTWVSAPSFTSNTQNLNNIHSGTYSLSIQDNNGCVKDTILKIAPTITIIANAGNDTAVCMKNSVVLSGTNSIGAVNYNWYVVPSLSTSIANTPTLGIPASTGTSTYVLQAISSASNCMAFDTVVVSTYSVPQINIGPSYTIPAFSSTVIGGSPTAPTAVSFTWSPTSTLINFNTTNPTATNTITTTYTLMVVDAHGCYNSDTVVVSIYPQLVIPNGFSPNGDGKNDYWQLDYIYQFPNNTVEVYNRWGEQLFYSKGYNVPFDGKYQGQDLPVGTYYYIINLNHPAYPKPFTGPLTIFR